jgi:hypothetical protein
MPTEMEQSPSLRGKAGWTLETLREYVQQVLHNNSVNNDNRFTAITREMESNTITLRSHITEAITALRENVLAQKEAVALAMQAADRAVTKAEIANEKRFESVNEFRASLADTSRLQMPRSETESLIKALNEKNDSAHKAMADRLDASIKSMNDKIDSLNELIVASEGRHSGMQSGWGYAFGAFGLLVAVATVIITLMAKH